jgi:hypothetical protein
MGKWIGGDVSTGLENINLATFPFVNMTPSPYEDYRGLKWPVFAITSLAAPHLIMEKRWSLAIDSSAPPATISDSNPRSDSGADSQTIPSADE